MGPPHPYIVVGVSGQSESLPAARWAVREADTRHLELVIAHAAPTPHGNPWNSEMVDVMVTDAEAIVDEAMSHLVIPPHLSVRRVVDPVPPVALLSRPAEQAEFVALGRENLAPSRRLTEGAVTGRSAPPRRVLLWSCLPTSRRHRASRYLLLSMGPRPLRRRYALGSMRPRSGTCR